MTVSWDSDTIRDDLRGDENPTRDPGRALRLTLSPEQTGNMPTCFPLPPSPGSSRDARDVDAVSTEDLTIEAVIGVATPVSNIATIARKKPPPQKRERENKHTHKNTNFRKSTSWEFSSARIPKKFSFQLRENGGDVRRNRIMFGTKRTKRVFRRGFLSRRCHGNWECVAQAPGSCVYIPFIGLDYLTVRNVERIQVSRTDGYVGTWLYTSKKILSNRLDWHNDRCQGCESLSLTGASPEVLLIWSGITIQHLDRFSTTPSINLNFNKYFIVTPLKYQHPSQSLWLAN